MFKAHRLLHHSPEGLGVIKKGENGSKGVTLVPVLIMPSTSSRVYFVPAPFKPYQNKFRDTVFRCQANVAHIRQSRPDSGSGLGLLNGPKGHNL